MTRPAADVKRGGYTIIELMMVMLLLSIFALIMLVLVQAGLGAYQTIAQNREAGSDARIALSYIDVRIRQNDQIGAVSVEDNPLGDGNALIIRETLEGSTYDTWVFFSEGVLYECALLLPDENPSVERSEEIARLVDFSFEKEGAAIRQKAVYLYRTAVEQEMRTLSLLVVLRTGGIT